MLYPPLIYILCRAIGEFAVSTLQEWTSILRLASKWGFGSIRSLAVHSVLPLASPVDKIALARTYGFDDWLLDAFVALCERPEPLSDDEAERMIKSDIAKIARAREAARVLGACPSTTVAKAAVAQAFELADSNSSVSPADISEQNVSSVNDPQVAGEFPPSRAFRSDEEQNSIKCVSPGEHPIKDSVLEATVPLWQILVLLRQGNWPESYRREWNSNWTYHDDFVKKMVRLAKNATKLRQIVIILLPNVMAHPFYFSTLLALVYDQLGDNTQLEIRPDGTAATPREMLKTILEEQCQQLIRMWDVAKYPQVLNDSHPRRQELMEFAGLLVKKGILTQEIIRSCVSAFLDLRIDENSPPAVITELCSVMVKMGKALDQEYLRDKIDDLFRRFGTILLTWQPDEVYDAVLVGCRSRPMSEI
jgi:hypothetical protein